MAESTAKNKGILGFFRGVRSEFRKIVWPAFDVLVKQTATVIVVAIIIGLLVAGIDAVYGALVGFIL